MKMLKRLLGAGLTFAMAASLLLPVHAADPLASSFVTASVSATTQDKVDNTQQKLRVDLLRRNSQGLFAVDDSVQYTCGVNRAAGYAVFSVKPKADKVWVEVDYLTDLDGNGTYEMLDGQTKPANDIMNTKGQLVDRSSVSNPAGDSSYVLTKGQTYYLSSTALKARAQAAIANRRDASKEPKLSISTSADRPVLYYISVHYYSTADNKSYTMGYYLSLFDKVIIPSDVKPGSWYYAPVEYGLDKGFFTGTGKDTFSPSGTVTRAQMAQILWRLGGSKTADNAGFSDVKTTDWFYKAVSWCKREGLMDGSSATTFNPKGTLTREQMSLVLRNYVQHEGLSVSNSKALTGFKDGATASSWAVSGLKWAVAEGLLSGDKQGTLRPRDGITRAELAAVLRTFCEKYPKIVH